MYLLDQIEKSIRERLKEPIVRKTLIDPWKELFELEKEENESKKIEDNLMSMPHQKGQRKMKKEDKRGRRKNWEKKMSRVGIRCLKKKKKNLKLKISKFENLKFAVVCLEN